MWPRMSVYKGEDTQQTRVVPVLHKIRVVGWLVLYVPVPTCAVGECSTWGNDVV